MAARAKTAKSTQKINDMLSGLTGKTSMDAFNRMEEKVLALEAAAEVSNEMAKTMMGRSLPSSKKDGASSIELQFRALESSDAVDKEMEEKAQGQDATIGTQEDCGCRGLQGQSKEF
jgi:phage shock protein A